MTGETINVINGRLHSMAHRLTAIRKLYETNKKVNEAYQRSIEEEYQRALLDWCEIKDLLGKVNKNGVLEWTAPEGKWELYAVSQSAKTGRKVKRAAPGEEGRDQDRHMPRRSQHKRAGIYLLRPWGGQEGMAGEKRHSQLFYCR